MSLKKMVKRNAYSLLLDLQNSLDFVKLLQKGIIPLTVLDKKVYYEFFLSVRDKNTRSLAIFLAAEEYGVSEMTIRRAIKFMES